VGEKFPAPFNLITKNMIRKLEHPERASQLIDLTGINYGNASPTDIDGFLEIKNKLFVFLEFKNENAPPIGYGQRTALERVVDALHQSGKVSLAIIGQHNTAHTEIVNGSESKALEIRWRGQWLSLKNKNYTVRDCVNQAMAYAFT